MDIVCRKLIYILEDVGDRFGVIDGMAQVRSCLVGVDANYQGTAFSILGNKHLLSLAQVAGNSQVPGYHYKAATFPICYIPNVEWTVECTDEFEAWWNGLSEEEQVSVAASERLLQGRGPMLHFRTVPA